MIMFFLAAVFFLLRYLWKLIRSEGQSVENEIVLITGAAQGIGKELALRYGRQGGTVVCVDVMETENQETVDELKAEGIKAFAYTCNVVNVDNVFELKDRVEKEVGLVTILIANAGIAQRALFIEDIDVETVKNLVDVNFFSLIWMVKAFLGDMKKRNKGHIVAIASITGLAPLPGLALYSVTKNAVSYLMRAAREEVELAGKNVKFTTIYPDFTETKMCQHLKTFMPAMLTPDKVAEMIINAQRRGVYEASIPRHYLPLSRLLSLIPSISGSQINYWVGKLEGIGNKRAWGNYWSTKN